jgi:hypothetical protein
VPPYGCWSDGTNAVAGTHTDFLALQPSRAREGPPDREGSPVAPEATAGPAFADERADLYSLGTAIYEMCAAVSPPTQVPAKRSLRHARQARRQPSSGTIFPKACARSSQASFHPTLSTAQQVQQKS